MSDLGDARWEQAHPPSISIANPIKEAIWISLWHEPIPLPYFPELCLDRMDKGTGNNPIQHYFFSRGRNRCRTFKYKGAKGNANRFITKKACYNTCQVCAWSRQLTETSTIDYVFHIFPFQKCNWHTSNSSAMDWHTMQLISLKDSLSELLSHIGTSEANSPSTKPHSKWWLILSIQRQVMWLHTWLNQFSIFTTWLMCLQKSTPAINNVDFPFCLRYSEIFSRFSPILTSNSMVK